MKIENIPAVSPVHSNTTDNSTSPVGRSSAVTQDNKKFQEQYSQQKDNLGQINLSKDHHKSATKQLQQLNQKDPAFPPLDQLMLLKECKPQIAILLTGRIVQNLNSKVWDTFSSSEKLQITSEHLESMCHFLNMDASELHTTDALKSLYLSENQLESYRETLILDKSYTHKWIFEKDEIHPHLMIQPHNPQFNAIADSLGENTRCIWDEIGDAHKGYFEFFEFDQFYQKKGYTLQNASMDFKAKSIILFGFKKDGIYQLKHAGRINEHGFYQSKPGTGGTILWPSPVADACPEYGQPLLQYIQKEEQSVEAVS